MEKTISKEALEKLPLVSFTGNWVVVNDTEQADAAVKAIRETGAIIGFDTETRPAFVKGVTYKVALVQLSVHDTVYLFRLNRIGGMPPSFVQLLEDPEVIKVGLSTPDDFGNMRKWGPINPRGFIEIQQLVTKYGIEDKSLARVYGLLFGKKISKRQRLTNWEAEKLTDKQLAYASLDAVACVEIYNELSRLGGSKIIDV